jgi:hypothetical protein
MKTSYHILYICLFFMASSGAMAQNGRTLTDEDIETIIRATQNNMQCPEPTERVVYRNQGSTAKLSIMLAGGLNYMQGAYSRDFNFESNRVSWHGELMLGYSYVTPSGNGGSTLGLFGRIGNTSADALERFNIDAGIDENMMYNADNYFLNIEGGAILLEVFRISTGIGVQEYATATSDVNRAFYYSTTAGLHLGTRNFKFLIEANFNYGRNIGQTIVRPQVGLGIRL